MKKWAIGLLLLLIGLLVFFQLQGRTVVKNGTPEQLGINLFEIIKNNQLDRLEEFFPTETEWGEILSVSTYDEQRIKEILGRHEMAHKKRMERSTKEFQKIRDSVSKKGDDYWKKAHVSDINVRLHHNNINVPVANVYVYYAHGGSEYTFEVYKCARAKRGWLITKRMELPRNYVMEENYKSEGDYVPKTAGLPEFGKKVFQLIKEKKKNEIAVLCPTKEETVNEMKLPAAMAEKNIKDLEKQMNAGLTKVYKVMDEAGKKFDPAVFVYTEYVYKDSFSPPLKQADLNIIFESGKTKYSLKCRYCLKLKRGWVLTGNFDLRPLR